MELHISVANKVATYSPRGGDIVCGNKDYTIRFTFDEEWDGITEKIARFIWNGVYADKPIVDGVCEVPLLHGTTRVQVGVYGGDLHTTTSATIYCIPSILCAEPNLNSDEGRVYESACAESAREAGEFADQAEQEATQARTSATAAAGSATTAAGRATAAANSATAAASASAAAQSAAAQAGTSAEEAAASASAAAQSAATVPFSRISNEISPLFDNLISGWIKSMSVNTSTGATIANSATIISELAPIPDEYYGNTSIPFYYSGMPINEARTKWFVLFYNANAEYLSYMSLKNTASSFTVNADITPIVKYARVMISNFADEVEMDEFINNNEAQLCVSPLVGATTAYKPYGYKMYEETEEYKHGLADYHIAEIERVKRAILDNTESANSIVFGVITDLHFSTEFTKRKEMELRALRKLADESILDFVANLGDNDTGTDKATAQYITECINNVFSGCKVPYLFTKGNHDTNSDEYYGQTAADEFTLTEWKKRMRMMERNVVFQNSPAYSLNYYYDIPHLKTRVIVADTGTYSVDAISGEFVPHADRYSWVMNTALSDDIKDGWRIIYMTHTPIDGTTWSNNFTFASTLFKAVNSGGTATGTFGDVTITKDFGDWTSKVVISCNGHVHCSRLSYSDGLAIAWTDSGSMNGAKAQATYEAWAEEFDNVVFTPNEGYGTFDGAEECMFDIFIVNSSNIHRVTFGHPDRDFTLALA